MQPQHDNNCVKCYSTQFLFNAAAIREYSLKLKINNNIAICVTSVKRDSMRLERLNV